jgi:hypothetical protein
MLAVFGDAKSGSPNFETVPTRLLTVPIDSFLGDPKFVVRDVSTGQDLAYVLVNGTLVLNMSLHANDLLPLNPGGGRMLHVINPSIEGEVQSVARLVPWGKWNIVGDYLENSTTVGIGSSQMFIVRDSTGDPLLHIDEFGNMEVKGRVLRNVISDVE